VFILLGQTIYTKCCGSYIDFLSSGSF
jgi:hypothetical protein